MQIQYQPNFNTLTAQEADYFADAILQLQDLKTDPIQEDLETIQSGSELFEKLYNHKVDHKTACMSLANDPSIIAITILEKVVGKPITRKIPSAAPVRNTFNGPKPEGAPRPRVSKIDPRIIHSIMPNPKKMGSKSWERYKFYQEGMTVTEFINAGGTTGDIQHDVSKGFIKLKDAE